MNPVAYFMILIIGAIGNGLNALHDNGRGAFISAACVFGIVMGIRTRFWKTKY